MLTRTGYIVSGGPLQEIKRELTVRPIVNGDYGFPPPPFKVSDQLRMECAFQDSTELLRLETQRKTEDPNRLNQMPNLSVSSETQPIKMKHWQQQLKQGTVSFLYHVATVRRRYPWP